MRSWFRKLKAAALKGAAVLSTATFAVVALPIAAYAQASGGIDFTPLVDNLMEVFAAALMGVITTAIAWGIRKFHQLTGIQVEDSMRQAVTSGLERAVRYGAQRVREKYEGKLEIRSENELINFGAKYMISSYPQFLAKLGVDISTEAGLDAIERMVASKTEDLLFDDDPQLDAHVAATAVAKK